MTLAIKLITNLLKHLCGGTRVYFKLLLLCIHYLMGSGAGH